MSSDENHKLAVIGTLFSLTVLIISLIGLFIFRTDTEGAFFAVFKAISILFAVIFMFFLLMILAFPGSSKKEKK